MPQKEVFSMSSTIRLRVGRFEQICRTAGHKTLDEQAAAVGLTKGGLSKIKNFKSGPDGRSIGAILTALPEWSFEDLFEVVPQEAPTGVAA